MEARRRRDQIWRALVMVAALLAVLATVMIPAITREAARQARAEVQDAVQVHMADFPPVMPATSVGDHYYQWSLFACPTGQYNPPERDIPENAVASAPVGDDG